MKIITTITVRTKSTRLPLKVLRLINGRPMIEQMIQRLKMARLPDDIVLCTSTNPQDDVLVDYAEKLGVRCFRGDEIDVLRRLYDASREFSAEFIVSATADNPLTDPVYIDRIVETYRATNADYITCLDLPLGTFAYGVKPDAIERVFETKKERDTEIWGVYFKGSGLFKRVVVEVEKELSRPELRLTVDTPEDLDLVRAVYRHLQGDSEFFELRRVVEFLRDNPRLLDINSSVRQRTGREEPASASTIEKPPV